LGVSVNFADGAVYFYLRYFCHKTSGSKGGIWRCCFTLLRVVVGPGRKFPVFCFVEVTSLSIFCAEPGRNCRFEGFRLDERGVELPGKRFLIDAGPGLWPRWYAECFLL
jgi:hypothetical protein